MSNILLLSTSGGSGHIQAALAMKEKLLDEDPKAVIFERNLSDDWWTWFGRYATHILWNVPQRRGMHRWLKFIWKQSHLTGFFFGLPTLFNAVRFFLYNDIDRVIVTHHLSYPTLFRALDIAKFFGRKCPKLEVVVIELPTTEKMYYYKSFRELNPKYHSRIEVLSVKPLAKQGHSDAEHWLRLAGLPFWVIKYIDFPLRKSFYVQTPGLTYSVGGEHLTSQDRVLTIMLGSQPTSKAILAYLKALEGLDLDKIFVMCSHQEKLLETVRKNSPDHVIGLGPQPASAIADLLIHSTYTLTRSGAITSQELLHLANGTILIHSETGDLCGMPEWEAGNALYLKEKKGAKLVTPMTIRSELGIEQTLHSPSLSGTDSTDLDSHLSPQQTP
ncbi:MAG: hypothetical protein SP1CHLAM54_15840 [Chlamydiia bacterium]|nr:hypothetical protein [Chlamydiia bacterium]MCH9616473.1 hypothetical protein [Chlamydiia bacterium]MCH9629541.1 hypothetical protein [Chlamydiia bacterium]